MGGKGQTQSTTYSVPDWENQDWQNLTNQANAQTNSDISSINYPGITNQFQQGTNSILKNQVNPQQLQQGIVSAGNASQAWTNPGVANSWMNPYENTALASQVKLDRQNLLNPELAQSDESAAAAGALGGDRAEIAKTQLQNNFNNTEANTIAQGENQAYNTGLGAFQGANAQALQGATTGAQTNLAGANSNVYANFAAGQNSMNEIAASEAPGQQLASEAGIMSSAPKQGTQQTTTTPNGGALGGIMGGLLGGAGQLLTGIGGLAKGGLVKKKTRRGGKRTKKAAK